MLVYGAAVDANWDDAMDVFLAEIQNNPLFNDDMGVEFNPLFNEGGHLLVSNGQGGFLLNDAAEVESLRVLGAVGVVGSSPTYGKEKKKGEKISKEEAEAIKAQLVEAGATVEVK